MSKIHPSAVIEEGAKIGKDVKIGAYSFVSKDAVIEDRVEIMQGAGVYGKSVIGEDTKLYPYVMIGTPPQDISYQDGDNVGVEVGKRNVFREFVTINAGTLHGNGVTRVGDDCFVMIYSHIAHDCQIGSNVIMANNATCAGHVEVGDFTVIGGMTPIHQFVKIGEGCMLGGASAISQDIPPFCLAEGNRAVVKGLNAVGLRRRFQKDDIRALQRAYKELFRSGRAIKDVAEELLDSSESEKVKQMCRFIIASKRGIPYERKN